eukprot:m.35036 g.35036  ORF g.35036 m.35036 type:complete len:75 (-) comp7401_c0_seq1:281-505(-)
MFKPRTVMTVQFSYVDAGITATFGVSTEVWHANVCRLSLAGSTNATSVLTPNEEVTRDPTCHTEAHISARQSMK